MFDTTFMAAGSPGLYVSPDAPTPSAGWLFNGYRRHHFSDWETAVAWFPDLENGSRKFLRVPWDILSVAQEGAPILPTSPTDVTKVMAEDIPALVAALVAAWNTPYQGNDPDEFWDANPGLDPNNPCIASDGAGGYYELGTPTEQEDGTIICVPFDSPPPGNGDNGNNGGDTPDPGSVEIAGLSVGKILAVAGIAWLITRK